MYLDHFKLKEKPFLLNTDPRFLWLGMQHKEALSLLQSGVQDNKGLLLLTGEIGSGKSMLISALISHLDRKRVVVAKLPDPGLERKEFFFLVAHSFGIDRKVVSRESFTKAMDRFLATLHSQEKKALLVIDEAQIMSPSILEEIRLLSNMEYHHAKQLNIFLVGQNDCNILLLKPDYRSLRERITTCFNLELLSANETPSYVSHRLKVAGTEKKIFTDAALHEIHVFSNGSPRQINIICDIALAHGFNAGVTIIDQEIIRACKDRVRVPKVPGRPLADELVIDEARWQTPEIGKYRPDSAALLSKTVKRMSWYSALVLLILLPSGYMLYSDWSRSFLPEKIPPLQKVLPTTPLQIQSRTNSLAPSPLLQHRPDDKNHKDAPVSDGTPDARVVVTIPATPLKDAIEKPTATSSAPNTSSKEPSGAGNAGRPSMENRSKNEATPKTGALQSNSKRVKNKAPQSQIKAQRVETVTSDTQVANPMTEPTDTKTAEPKETVPKKTEANRPSADKLTSGSGKTGEPIRTDTKTPSSEAPDPDDIINWLLQEKDK